MGSSQVQSLVMFDYYKGGIRVRTHKLSKVEAQASVNHAITYPCVGWQIPRNNIAQTVFLAVEHDAISQLRGAKRDWRRN